MAELEEALRSFEQVKDPEERRLFLTRVLKSLSDVEKQDLVRLMADLWSVQELTSLTNLARTHLSLQPDLGLEEDFEAALANFESRLNLEELDVERAAKRTDAMARMSIKDSGQRPNTLGDDV